MCDSEMMQRWAKNRINRREFGMVAGAATLAACAPSQVSESKAGEGGGAGSNGGLAAERVSGGLALAELSFPSIETSDGVIDGVFVAPETGEHPGVIFWPDIASIRQSKIEMAQRLASEGYAVLIMNPYYRDVSKDQFADFADFIQANGFQKVGSWRAKLDAEAIMRDAKAAVGWLDAQSSVDSARGIGTEGYCMGGPFTVWSAAAMPDRIKAAASFHGGGLVRPDNPASPHALIGDSAASFLIAVARDDDAKDPQAKTTFDAAAKAADRPATVKVYDGDHGWTVPDAPSFAQEAADLAYADKLALYKGAL